MWIGSANWVCKFVGASGWDAFAQQNDFEEAVSKLLGCKVDVVAEHAHMRPHFREELSRDALPV